MDATASVRELLAEYIELPEGDDAELKLPSLALIVIAEELEQRHGFLVAAREMVPENFGSVTRLAAYLIRKLEARAR